MRKICSVLLFCVMLMSLGCGGEPSKSHEQSGELVTVNVKDFGAVGNGEKDDTEALKAAVDEIMKNSGGTLYLPAGKYIVKDRISLAAPVISLTVKGDGANSTEIIVQNDKGFFEVSVEQRGAQIQLNDLTISADNAGIENAFSFKMPEGGNRHNRSLVVENVKIQNMREGTYFITALDVPGQWRSLFKNLQINNEFGYQDGEIGVNSDGTYAPIFDNCIVINYKIGVSIVSQKDPAPEGGSIKSSVFSQCQIGVKVSSPSVEPQMIIDGNDFDCTNIGLWVAGRKYIQIVNCNFLYTAAESAAYTDLLLDSAVGSIVGGNTFSGDGINRKGVEITGRFSKENMIVNNVFDMTGTAVISNIESNIVKNNVFSSRLTQTVQGPHTV